MNFFDDQYRARATPARIVNLGLAEPIYRDFNIDFRNVVFSPASVSIVTLGSSVSNATF
jgi:hypothetical protein